MSLVVGSGPVPLVLRKIVVEFKFNLRVGYASNFPKLWSLFRKGAH
jgi:hypothetical protein